MTNIAASHPVEPRCNDDLNIGTPTTEARQNRRRDESGFQAPRRIWQSNEARLPRKVFHRTYVHSAQKIENKLIGIGPFMCRAIAGAPGRRACRMDIPRPTTLVGVVWTSLGLLVF
jgi:hypothetical protein